MVDAVRFKYVLVTLNIINSKLTGMSVGLNPITTTVSRLLKIYTTI